MAENNEKVNQLLDKLDSLLRRQEYFSMEINELRLEINKLTTSQDKAKFEDIKSGQSGSDKDIAVEKEPVMQTNSTNSSYYENKDKEQSKYSAPANARQPKIKSDIEKFIGENLINKIGIAITVIGVAIGAKYSIEHELISPLTRIILGYLMGLGLLGVGIKLKGNYNNYSAVLVSGAIAILYFITYAAYSFYELIPQSFAFALMVVFTTFTVVAAINYNKQVIAHIGLVGAYAVPFLLSEGSGKVAILFSYMAIINIGILVIAIKKYWKPLYYSSFLLTWLIYFAWFTTNYKVTEHFQLALVFVSVFFAIFYLIFLGYKLLQKEKFESSDILLLIANSFIFYGIGYTILNAHQTGEQLLGLFTLCNAIVHFIVSLVIYRQKLADRNLFFLVAGLVLAFITIAIPVQLDGNWVTLLWAFEAALLFWIGRTKSVPVYEKLSYILMFLAFYSICHDWATTAYNYYPDQPGTRVTPFLNIYFLTSALFVASFVFINSLNANRKYVAFQFSQKAFNSIIAFSIPAILLIVLYNSFRLEISSYCSQLYIDSAIEIKIDDQEYPNTYWNYDLKSFETIWVINYSLLFFSILSFVNIKKLRNRKLGLINMGLNAFVVFVFLTLGLIVLTDLRQTYLNHILADYYQRSGFNIGIRYISLAFAGFMLFSIYRYIRQDFIQPISDKMKVAIDFLLYTSILWMASSELITWMDMMRFSQSDKLGLSILWGIYALVLIALGIWKGKKHLRIGAIGLFAVTLIKLFIYDISHLDTIAKTIVFVSLGVLLLIISFLYNKYKHLIAENEN